MKDSQDNDLQEKELHDYLSGSDGISAAYQALPADRVPQDEKPSAVLDESILQTARESVAGSSTQKKGIHLQAYSIAASVCVAVLVVSLFLNNETELTGTDFEALSIPVSDAPMAEIMSADAAPASEMDISNANAVSEQLAPAATRIALPAPLTEAAEQEAEAFSNAIELSIETTAQESQRAAEPESQEELLELARGVQTEEIIEFAFVYRQNVETWLLEIQRLSDIENQIELVEERRLFTESYPNVDIDSALIEIQNSN